MGKYHHVAVIDIGKTNAKVALVNLVTLSEISVRRRPNCVLARPPFPHYDVDGLWQFILESLRDLNSEHRVDAITVTTHGAAAALLNADGALAAPVLDYEHDGPDRLAADYDAIRPPFDETGSPRLPMGLNLGAQLFWQFQAFPDIRAKTQTILTYPQYWVFRLTGIVANEVSSLGCHTDLWCPNVHRYSSLVEEQGWAGLMAPVSKATDIIGTVLPDLARSCGLSDEIPVYCGIHDSNASLYGHLAQRKTPFSVVSTGTWVISMAIGGKAVLLDPARDTLINVNAVGNPVPSARFMGGREFERMIDGHSSAFGDQDVAEVLAHGTMILPAVENKSGPFQGRNHRWTRDETSLSDGQRCVVLSFYLAMMTATGLGMTGAAGDTLVEGPFSDNDIYLDMLAAATGRPVHAIAGTGTSVGAALLTAGEVDMAPIARGVARNGSAAFSAYARQWWQHAEGLTFRW